MYNINYSIDIQERHWSINFRNKIIDYLLDLLKDITWEEVTFYDQDQDQRHPINLEDRCKYLDRKASATNLILKSGDCIIEYDEYHRKNSDIPTVQALSLKVELSFFKEIEKKLTQLVNTIFEKTEKIGFSIKFVVDDPQEEPYLNILERYKIEAVSGMWYNIFTGNDYIRIITPAIYEPYFTKEDLLATPAYKVYEWDDEGRIFMQFYETAWDYDNPKAMGQIKRALDYLNACKKSPLDGLDLD